MDLQPEEWTERRRFFVFIGCQAAYAFCACFSVFAFLMVYRLSQELQDWRALLAYPVVMLAWPLRLMWMPERRKKR